MFLKCIVLVLFLFLNLGVTLHAQDSSASINKAKPQRNYIRTCIYTNIQTISDGRGRDAKRKKVNDSFGYTQFNIGFFTPLYTKTWESKDGIKLPSFQLLGTGNFQYIRANFSASEKPENFSRLTLGLRGIYSNGRKSIFMLNFSPFLSNNQLISGRQTFRFTAMFLYSRSVSPVFSYQLGINRTFLYGRAFWMPVVGIRLGRLDRFHAQLAFPRNFSLNLPVGQQWLFRAYTKASGGVFNLQNFDSLYTGQSGNNILFGMSEILTGLEVNFSPGRTVSLFLSAGISSARRIGFYENSREIGGNPFELKGEFIALKPTGFFQAGIAIRLGRARDIYNHTSMYDAAELNSIFDPGDVNQRVPGSNVPADPEKARLDKLSKNQLRDIKDYFYEE